MSQLWIFLESLVGDAVVPIPSDEARHVAARRLRVGDAVVAFDGAGRTAAARIETLGKRRVELRVDRVEQAPEPGDRWILATAIPKGERLGTMLPMLVQLGVPIWQPLVLAESAVRDLDVGSARMQRILVESAKLARRPWMMEVREPCGLDALLANSRFPVGPAVLCYGDREGGEIGVPDSAALVVIGPEAGLDGDEIRRLQAVGARACSLGMHNMRIETAAVAAAAVRFAAREAGRAERDG